MEKTKVLYVMGDGRSGSTLLDIILGLHKNITSGGELLNLVTSGFLNNEYCSCGKKFLECYFWQCIKNKCLKNRRKGGIEEYDRLRQKYERIRKIPLLFFFKNVMNCKNDLKKYQDFSLAIFQSIASCSSTKIIVDSSKNPSRALLLSQNRHLDVYVVHLTRDARGVVWSQMKSFSKDDKSGIQHDLRSRSGLKTALRWLLVNILSELVGLATNNTIHVKYEDLVNNPQVELRKIFELIGEDLKEVIGHLEHGCFKHERHILAGNRLRMQKDIRLKEDVEWKHKLSRKDKIISSFVAFPLLWKYGYFFFGSNNREKNND